MPEKILTENWKSWMPPGLQNRRKENGLDAGIF